VAEAEGEERADVIGVKQIDHLVRFLASIHEVVEQLVEPLDSFCLIASRAGSKTDASELGAENLCLYACWTVSGVTGEPF